VCCIDSDHFYVERHSHKHQASKRDRAGPDQKKEICPLPRPKNIGCNHDLILVEASVPSSG
jgi:hypothetical protein